MSKYRITCTCISTLHLEPYNRNTDTTFSSLSTGQCTHTRISLTSRVQSEVGEIGISADGPEDTVDVRDDLCHTLLCVGCQVDTDTLPCLLHLRHLRVKVKIINTKYTCTIQMCMYIHVHAHVHCLHVTILKGERTLEEMMHPYVSCLDGTTTCVYITPLLHIHVS